MSYLRIYSPNSDDTSNEGLCGPLLATQSTFSISAGTFGELSATVVRDEPIRGISKWKSIAPGCIVKTAVPVRQCNGFGEVRDRIYGDETVEAVKFMNFLPASFKYPNTSKGVTYSKPDFATGTVYTKDHDVYLHNYLIFKGLMPSNYTWKDISKTVEEGDQDLIMKSVQEHLGIFLGSNVTTSGQKEEVARVAPKIVDGYIDLTNPRLYDQDMCNWIVMVQKYLSKYNSKTKVYTPTKFTYNKVSYTFTFDPTGRTYTAQFDKYLRYYLISKKKISAKTSWTSPSSDIVYGTESKAVAEIKSKIATLYLKMTTSKKMLAFVQANPVLMDEFYTVENNKLVAVTSAKAQTIYQYTIRPTTTAKERALYKKADGKNKSSNIPVTATLEATGNAIKTQKDYIKVTAHWTTTSKKKTTNKTASGWISIGAIQNLASPVEQVTLIDSVAESDGDATYTIKDQLFRIHEVTISDSDKGTIEIKARHIAYDLMGNLSTYKPDENTGEISCSDMCVAILSDTVSPHDFRIHSDMNDEMRVVLDVRDMNPIQAICDTSEGILSKWQYAQVFADNYDIFVLSQAGMNRGFTIKYGKNLTGISCTTDQSEVTESIRPVGEAKSGAKLYLDGVKYNGEYYYSLESKKPSGTAGKDYYDLVYDSAGNETPGSTSSKAVHKYYDYKLKEGYKFLENDDGSILSNSTIQQVNPVNHFAVPKIATLDVSDAKVDDKDVKTPLAKRRLAQACYDSFENGANDIKIDLDVEFRMLGDTEELAQYRQIERMFVYDTVPVTHHRLGISSVSEVLKIEFDTILERFQSAEIGAIKNATAAVASWQISSVNGGSIVSGSVPGGAIAENAIAANHIQAGSISAQHLTADAITANTATFANLIVRGENGSYYKMTIDEEGNIVPVNMDPTSEEIQNGITEDGLPIVSTTNTHVEIDSETGEPIPITDDKVKNDLNNEISMAKVSAHYGVDVGTTLDNSVNETTDYYKVNDSPDIPPEDYPLENQRSLSHEMLEPNGWTKEYPMVADDEYIWNITKTVTNDGQEIYSEKKCISGTNPATDKRTEVTVTVLEGDMATVKNALWQEGNDLYFGDRENYERDFTFNNTKVAKITNDAFIVAGKRNNVKKEFAKYDDTGMTVNESFKIVDDKIYGMIITRWNDGN